ncbi:TlpA family protein disulfide reductase [Modestobacter lapidis]|nr:TlpA family protein disulfide reductase [Modestobacter lapidis]
MSATRLAALPAALLLLAGCTGGPGDAAPAPQADVSSVDTALPPCADQPDEPSADSELPAVAFDCFAGGSLDLARAQGAPTVVNLWASWCGPCREELPVVQELADVAGDRVRVLGLVSKDGVPQSASFAADAGLTFPSAFDGDGEVMASLGLNNLPHTVFLAADGSVAHLEVGPVDSLAEFQQLVAEHLGVEL